MQENGVFYTNANNPFRHHRFIAWAKELDIKNQTILEPFAGANHIINCIKELGLCENYKSFDINPNHDKVKKQDTLTNFPSGYKVCITNPPWLYKSRAKRLGLKFPATQWDDLYKLSLEKILDSCDNAAVLIPASFLNGNNFIERLESVILIHNKLFYETENPVCLAMFKGKQTKDTEVFIDEKYIGMLSEIKSRLPIESNNNISFNIKNGSLGLIAIDNTKEKSIRFCRGEELNNYNITNSSRSITRIGIDGFNVDGKFINNLNNALNELRENTYDIFMTPFKGLRKDGMYRRRLDYKLARNIISEVIR